MIINQYLYNLILAVCLFVKLSLQAVIPLPNSVITELATREYRYHHYIWHNVRENWNRFPNATKKAFTDIGWAPPNPARSYDAAGRSSAVLDNFSGEDFLYMHRQMIAKVNDILTKNREAYGKVTGWTSIPAPGDVDYPVPANYTVPGSSSTTTATWKSDSFYERSIKAAERTFKDPAQLRRMNLSEFGARMEVTVHSWMHMRWSAASAYGYRTSYRGTIPFIDKKWDNSQYNWLGDSYGSHVNPVFWKLHGWVDDRLEDWRKANNLTSIRWRGTWTGGPMSNLTSVTNKMGSLRGAMDGMGESGGEVGDVMEQALQILLSCGIPEVSFADASITGFLPGGYGDEDGGKKVCKAKSVKEVL